MSVSNLTLAADIATRRRIGATLALVALVVLLMLISLGIGPVRLSPVTVIEARFGGGSDVSQGVVREIGSRMILPWRSGLSWDYRGGAAGLLRNPLASPSLSAPHRRPSARW
jgi:iron complex transport system permease protein